MGALRVPIASLGASLMLWDSWGIATIREEEIDIALVICPARARVKAFAGSRVELKVALHGTLLAMANCLLGCNGCETWLNWWGSRIVP